MFTLIVLQSKHTLLQFPVYCTRDSNVLFKSITNNGNEKGGYSHYNKVFFKSSAVPDSASDGERKGQTNRVWNDKS